MHPPALQNEDVKVSPGWHPVKTKWDGEHMVIFCRCVFPAFIVAEADKGIYGRGMCNIIHMNFQTFPGLLQKELMGKQPGNGVGIYVKTRRLNRKKA